MNREYKLGEVCAHDHLARQCPLCERDDEIAQLRAYRDKTEAALRRLQMHVTMVGGALHYDLRRLGLWREPPKDGGA